MFTYQSYAQYVDSISDTIYSVSALDSHVLSVGTEINDFV